MIEIYLLEALDAFYRLGTLSAAAEYLHISQPALSRSMQKLEDILDVQLFERTKNRITLNKTGKLAAVHARRILDSEEEMISIVRNFDRSLNTISVGFCAPGPIMELPSHLARMYPKMKISSELSDEQELIKGLHSRKYTMIILSYPYQEEGVTGFHYGSEHLYISLVPAHPAVMYKDQGLSFKDMNGETFVMSSRVGIWEALTRRMMPDSRLILQDDPDALNAVVNASSLPAFATDLTIHLFRSDSNPDRIFIPLKDPEATMQYYCVLMNETLEKLSKWTDFLAKKANQT